MSIYTEYSVNALEKKTDLFHNNFQNLRAGHHEGNLPKYLFPIVDRGQILQDASNSLKAMINHVNKSHRPSAHQRTSNVENCDEWAPILHFIEGEIPHILAPNVGLKSEIN